MSGDELYSAQLKALAGQDHPSPADRAGMARRSSPLCGDRVDVGLDLDHGRIAALGCQVRGCLLCRASASVFLDRGVGLDRAGLDAALEHLRAYLNGADRVPAWPEWQVFAPVRGHPSRHGCVTLALETARDAFERAIPGDAVTAIVLAAGRSSRMGGRHKLGLPWGEETMLRHVVGNVAALSGIAEIVVVGRQGQEVLGALDGLPVRCMTVPADADGMAVSLRAAMAAVPERVGAVLLCLADMPLVASADMTAVLAAWQTDKPLIVRPRWQGRPGHPVLFRHDLFASLRHVQGDQGARGVIAAHAAQVRFVEATSDGVVVDVDSPEDYLGALARRR